MKEPTATFSLKNLVDSVELYLRGHVHDPLHVQLEAAVLGDQGLGCSIGGDRDHRVDL